MIHQLATDETIGAPDNIWTALGVIGGAIGAALVYAIVQLIKAWRAPEPRTETIAGERYDVTGMSESLVKMLSDALNRAADAEASAAAHEDRIKTLEATRGLLIVEVVTLRNGVENGTIPPLHALDPRIAHLINPAEPEP